VGHDSATAEKVPHFPAESCPTSERNAAPLQTESVPHFDRNPHHGQDLIEYALIAALIAVACVAGMKSLATAISTEFGTASGDLT